MGRNENTLRPGLQGEVSIIVNETHTARHMGSGRREVLATPMLVALVEAAAENAVAHCLAEGQQTVGVHLDVTHDAATPVGMRVRAVAELLSVSGRTLVFRVTAHDETEEIASGTHTRTVAQAATLDRMLQKKQKK